jgi:rfaE bifunctional protein kinase chain/domain
MAGTTPRINDFDVTKFRTCKIAVMGDVMLDTWYRGQVNRISPEAPVPVLEWSHTEHHVGGAANVAVNLAHLGAQVKLFGMCGTDDSADVITHLICCEPQIQNHVVRSDTRITTQKIRISTPSYQITRVDREHTHVLSDSECYDLMVSLSAHLHDCDAVIVSDYAKGVVQDKTCAWIRSWCQAHDKIWLVDPKRKNWHMYSGAHMITPNWSEYAQVSGQKTPHTLQLPPCARQLCAQYQFENMLITQAERGMTLVNAQGHAHVNAQVRAVADVSGAGDTVISVMALGMASGLSPVQSMYLANLAAGIGVSKPGTASITPEELQLSLKCG